MTSRNHFQNNDSVNHSDAVEDGIAIVGMAGRFPGAANVDELWEALCAGKELITFFKREELHPAIKPELIDHSNYVMAKGIINDVDKFDARFFGFNEREASIMDPQHRIFLEIAWESLEHAGYSPDNFDGLIGVYAGMGNNTYYKNHVSVHPNVIAAVGELQAMMANEKDYLTTRVSYKLNLTGPSVNIHTACSTSLTAVCHACESLFNYQCDMALAGGISVFLPQNAGYVHKEVNIFSKDGHCRPFDSGATGTVSSNGAGVVVLKRLNDAYEDGDKVYGVIRGYALNNDGSGKMSYTAPSIDGQANVVAMALAEAGMEPSDISYIETHGTGTRLGDPIEIEALNTVHRSGPFKKNSIAIGSIKSNIGHLDTAAGVTSLIKTALALDRQKLPPSINFEKPNPEIDFANGPFFVNHALSDWTRCEIPRRAGVSSFGIGGTNAHVIVEEAKARGTSGPSRPRQLILMSAKTQVALNRAIDNMGDYLMENKDVCLADVAFVLKMGKTAFRHRAAFVCRNIREAATKSNAANRRNVPKHHIQLENPDVVFMFPGQGAQYVNMGLNFYTHEPLFREIVDQSAEILRPVLGKDIRDVIYPQNGSSESAANQLMRTCYNQPAIFIVEYALARLLMSWGINPSAMIGHSVGEYTAACLAGVLELKDALNVVAARGRLMESCEPGVMLTVNMPVDQIRKRLAPDHSIAAVNAPSLCVISGTADSIGRLKQNLDQEKIFCRMLKTSHAFHSHMMEPISDRFRAEMEKVRLSSPHIPFISTAYGDWISDEQAIDPEYWSHHLRNTVLFSDGVKKVWEDPNRILLEVGPRMTATTLARRHITDDSKQFALFTLKDTSDNDAEWDALLEAVGRLWMYGVRIDWKGFYGNETRHRIPLPTYPFEKKRHWLSAGRKIDDDEPISIHSGASVEEEAYDIRKNDTKVDSPEMTDTDQSEISANGESGSPILNLLVPIWKKVLPDVDRINANDDFFQMGGHSLMAVELFSEIHKKTGIDLPLATLFDAPTLAQMTKIIEDAAKSNPVATTKTDQLYPQYEKGTSNGTSKQAECKPKATSWSPLVAIQPKGGRPPIFLVHTIGGNVLNYYRFKADLGPDQPIYGLQAKGLDGITEPYRDIETMAADYIAEIRTIQPRGPYYLGGSSMGGLIAYEMAIQLKMEGEEIAFLVLFDTTGPYNSLKNRESPKRKGRLSLLLRHAREVFDRPLLDQAPYVFHRVIPIMKERLIRKKCDWLLKTGRAIPHKYRYDYVWRKHFAIVTKHKYKRYDGKIMMFRAISEPREYGYDPNHGWSDIVEEIEVVEIPGAHDTFVEEPPVGDHLRICLEKAQKIGK